jgi:hypothetical protein
MRRSHRRRREADGRMSGLRFVRRRLSEPASEACVVCSGLAKVPAAGRRLSLAVRLDGSGRAVHRPGAMRPFVSTGVSARPHEVKKVKAMWWRDREPNSQPCREHIHHRSLAAARSPDKDCRRSRHPPALCSPCRRGRPVQRSHLMDPASQVTYISDEARRAAIRQWLQEQRELLRPFVRALARLLVEDVRRYPTLRGEP